MDSGSENETTRPGEATLRALTEISGKMDISAVHSFLVPPAAHEDEAPPISGTEVERSGLLFKMVREICTRAPEECEIEIMFRPDQEGTTKNDSRNRLENYARNPSLPNGRTIASHLQSVTTNRSGLGLLFLVNGVTGRSTHTLVVSRFPAEEGVMAEAHAEQLDVQFIEQVFLKNRRTYKSAMYQTPSLTAGFEMGRVIDRQLSLLSEASQYWVNGFLASETCATARLGSERLADAIRTAVNRTKIPWVKQDLIAATQLLRNQEGEVASPRLFLDSVGVSQQAAQAVETAFQRREMMDQSFPLDSKEFSKRLSYRMVELDNGAMAVAEDENFDQVWQIESMNEDGALRYSTEGQVRDQTYRLRK